MPQAASTRTEIEQQICRFIAESFLSDGQAATLRSDADLLTMLDSLQVLRTVMHIESEFSVKVEHGELTPENLGTVERLAGLVHRKLGRGEA